MLTCASEAVKEESKEAKETKEVRLRLNTPSWLLSQL
jgi:hypothetical protein